MKDPKESRETVSKEQSPFTLEFSLNSKLKSTLRNLEEEELRLLVISPPSLLPVWEGVREQPLLNPVIFKVQLHLNTAYNTPVSNCAFRFDCTPSMGEK